MNVLHVFDRMWMANGEYAKHNGANRKKCTKQCREKWLNCCVCCKCFCFLSLLFCRNGLNWAWMVHVVRYTTMQVKQKILSLICPLVAPIKKNKKEGEKKTQTHNVTMFFFLYVFSFIAHLWCVSNCLPFSAYIWSAHHVLLNNLWRIFATKKRRKKYSNRDRKQFEGKYQRTGTACTNAHDLSPTLC